MIKNPIIHRELLGLLRQPKAVVIQIGFVAMLAILVVAVWPDSATVNLGGRQAQQLLSVYVYGLMVALMLLASIRHIQYLPNSEGIGKLSSDVQSRITTLKQKL